MKGLYVEEAIDAAERIKMIKRNKFNPAKAIFLSGLTDRIFLNNGKAQSIPNAKAIISIVST